MAISEETLQAQLQAKFGEREIDNYCNIIYKMLRDNFNISDIIKYLKFKDFKCQKQTERYVIKMAEKYFNREEINKKTVKRRLMKNTQIITRVALITYLTTINYRKSKRIRKAIPLLRKAYPIITEMEKSFHYLSNCLKDKEAVYIDKFIETYKNSKISKLKNFAVKLKKDIKPVKAGIQSGITSGFVEGGNNKIKLIKRISYGRMKFKRLSHKILVTALFFND